MNLTKTNWPGGWVPDQDPINGDPGSLIRMDNLQQEQNGVLSLVRPIKQITTTGFNDYVDVIFSRLLGSNEVLWASIGATSTSIVRSLLGDFTDTVVIGNGNGRTFYGDCLGQTLILAGSVRLKDDTVNVLNLGLQTCLQPQVSAVSQPTLAFYQSDQSTFVERRVIGTWALVEGQSYTPDAVAPDGGSVLVNPIDLRGIVKLTLPSQTDTLNVTTNGIADNPEGDLIQLTVTPDDSSQVNDITITFSAASAEDYYTYTFSGQILQQGLAIPSTISQYRGFFTRSASVNPNFNWSTITKISVVVRCFSAINCKIEFVNITGGATGQINGVYNYIAVAVNDNGVYVAKSPCSVPSATTTIINGFAGLTCDSIDPQVTEIWYYRISVATSNMNLPANLDQYYRVAVGKPFQFVQDTTSDDDAIELNIVLNPFLLSVQPLADGNGIGEQIIGVEGLFNERMIYLTPTSILLSDQLNPDAIDSRYTLKAESDTTEGNLWIKKLTNNVLILGTNKDLYELSGTLLPLPDGTVDVSIVKLGEKYPPITTDCCNISGGGITYVASDGIRTTAGSNTQLISPQLRLLFQGEPRVGFAPVVISRYANYRIAAGKTKLWVTIPFQDGTRQLLVYDFVNSIWRIQITDPVTVYVTQKDRVLAGYDTTNSFGLPPGQIFEVDAAYSNTGGSGFLDTSGNLYNGFYITFITVYDANQTPRNRKDTFTLKLIIDTGGSDCSVYVGIDGKDFLHLQDINTSGLTTVYIPMDAFTLGFRYAFKIVDKNYVTKFTLYEMTLEYDPRPEQVNYLRIQPSNLNTISRKRFVNYAFVIDTLGNPITFLPLIDNSNTNLVPPSTIFTTQVKQTCIHYFLEETIGTDISGILIGPNYGTDGDDGNEGVFEFYGLNTDEIVSEKLPVPVEFLVIPANNYGTPHRKRHSSYKFQINTRGKNVLFTPILDGASYDPRTFNTPTKQTVEYFFDTSNGDIIGIDIGGTLATEQATPFEFYGVVTPEEIETLPSRLEFFRIPNSNLSVAARKRVRTLPLVIDTYGKNVQFTPIVDGVNEFYPAIFNTIGKTTVFYYFQDDSFGVDYGGQLVSVADPVHPFEFYGLGNPEIVETLPVGKVYDQINARWDKIAKIFNIRIRMIMTGITASVPYILQGDDGITVPFNAGPWKIVGSFNVNPLYDQIYEIQLPKSINTRILRLILGPTSDSFHRYDVQFRVSLSGMETDAQWQTIR